MAPRSAPVAICATNEQHGNALRVLVFPKNGENAYLGNFSDSLELGGAVVHDFDFHKAFLAKYDVVHFHWPEVHLRTDSVWRAMAKHARLALLFTVLRVRGTRIVWMVHNLKSHEGDHRVSEWLFAAWFPRYCTHVIGLTESGLKAAASLYPALRRKPAAVVPHGHYRGVYPPAPPGDVCRNALGIKRNAFTFLFVGTIRPYKNVPLLIKAFRELTGDDVQLVIAGLPNFGMEAEELVALAKGDDRIHLHLRFIDDHQIPLFLGAADLVVLPFNSILNSGSVLLALSLDRRVLVPRLGAMEEIHARVGSRWLHLYDGPLTTDLLLQARGQKIVDEQVRPDLSAFDWGGIGAAVLDFYRSGSAVAPAASGS